MPLLMTFIGHFLYFISLTRGLLDLFIYGIFLYFISPVQSPTSSHRCLHSTLNAMVAFAPQFVILWPWQAKRCLGCGSDSLGRQSAWATSLAPADIVASVVTAWA